MACLPDTGNVAQLRAKDCNAFSIYHELYCDIANGIEVGDVIDPCDAEEPIDGTDSTFEVALTRDEAPRWKKLA